MCISSPTRAVISSTLPRGVSPSRRAHALPAVNSLLSSDTFGRGTCRAAAWPDDGTRIRGMSDGRVAERWTVVDTAGDRRGLSGRSRIHYDAAASSALHAGAPPSPVFTAALTLPEPHGCTFRPTARGALYRLMTWSAAESMVDFECDSVMIT